LTFFHSTFFHLAFFHLEFCHSTKNCKMYAPA
jgi:hypothetical protein